ncbi:hypothetical protein CHUAL_012270 [Chamberlinius hualienensis]
MSRSEQKNYEKERIDALREERERIQKKTFTKWVNSFLQKARMEVDDLFKDLRDGKKLLKLLEIISGEKLGKPNNGKTRVHYVENVNKSLAFLLTKVRLESIGAEDIVDGKERLTLGLIWTIILRFQIQEIEIDVDEDNSSSEKKSARDALLLWCQRKTAGYRGVDIRDFSNSWRNGLGFNALIHAHRPDLLDYNQLIPSRHLDNLNNAFDVAHRHLEIARLLDAEDIDIDKPDEKLIMTYVASYYHTFAKQREGYSHRRRLVNILGHMVDIEKKKGLYESFTTTLLDWITAKTAEIEDRNFPNTLEGIQAELLKFKTYRTEEKPPKYRERSEIEAMVFSIQTKLKALNQPLYTPPEGKLVHDIERAWQELEKAEHRREVDLRNALLRQEKLEQLAYKFERKSVLREGYLKEMVAVLSDPRYGSNIVQVEATIKKHEAISTDILSRADRFRDLSNMAKELFEANYHKKESIMEREKVVIEKWNKLLQLLEKHRLTLLAYSSFMILIREIDSTIAEIKALETTLSSDDFGKHLIAVEDLVQKRALLDSQITIQGETVKRLNLQGTQFLQKGHKDGPVLQKRLDKMNSEFIRLTNLSKAQQDQLEGSKRLMEFMEDHEEEEAWVKEKQQICKAVISGKDLLAVVRLQQKHKVLEDEMKARFPKLEQFFKTGETLANNVPEGTDIKSRVDSLKEHWKKLQELAAQRTKQLEEAVEACQFYSDINEAESWMNEKLSLVTSEDYGKDASSAKSQLQRHNYLEEEIKAYSTDINRLNEEADNLLKDGIKSLRLSEKAPVMVSEVEEEYVEEIQVIPYEEETQETVYNEVLKNVTQEHRVPQLRALYPFSGQGIEMSKGEEMVLIHKTNEDWWNIRKSNGQEGFVPALYVKEIEPKIFRKTVQKVVKVPEIKTVKKIVNRRQVVRKKVQKSPLAAAKILKSVNQPHKTDNVAQKREYVNVKYDDLLTLSDKRRQNLEDAIRLFSFYFECDDLAGWTKEKEKLLMADDASESIDSRRRKFENFSTDLSACSSRLDDIDGMANELDQMNHRQMPAIRQRQQQIHDRWDKLNRMKLEKEKLIEGASSVELFNRNCDEACEWMEEKMNKLDTDDLGKDLKTVQALQRKHENLERELAPVEEKVRKVNRMASSVIANYPMERANVEACQLQLQQTWENVQRKAKERKARLEEAVGMLAFNNSAKSLLAWAADVNHILNSAENATDVATAQRLLKNHYDLADDIKAHESEFIELETLGATLLKSNPDNKEFIAKLAQLQQEKEAIEKGWKDKEEALKQSLKLQFFNREADQIDAMTGSHETFLDFDKLGSSIDEVNALIKRHDDFENTLLVHGDRLKSFNDTTNNLINNGHEKSNYIDDRRHQVLERRAAVEQKAHQRKGDLLDAKAFHEFQANVDEMTSWIQDKLRTAKDESYRDLSNLERKLKQHEAFESELRANEGRLYEISSTGGGLINEGHYNCDNIRIAIDGLTTQWAELNSLAKDKGDKLRQATALHLFKRTTGDVEAKLGDIEDELNSHDVGGDMQGTKYHLKRHTALENDLSSLQNKADDLQALGESMAQQGHYDAPTILEASRKLKSKCSDLEEPVAKRRAQLETALEQHQFTFEVETELQWITDHLPLAINKDLGQSLLEVQNLMKKQQKLEWELTGHQPVIDRVFGRGEQLIEDGHCSKELIQSKCNALKEAWDGIWELTKERKDKLELSLRAQQFLHETNELEAWMNEKNDLLQSQDYGKDEDAAIKLLTKHKALELEVDTYNGLVNEISNQAQNMIDAKHPDLKVIQGRQKFVLQEMKNLHKLASARRSKLMESRLRHEYFRESEELEIWINEQMQTAKSEDYGQDFEHVVILLNKFDDFRQRVEHNSERFVQCEELAKKLLSHETPFAGDIERRRDQLRKTWANLMEQIELRRQKLASATEIHCFNRDVSETLFRIQEKYAAISDDLGRDVNSAMSLLRKHEGFENDLVPLEARLQVLLDDSAQLQMAYQGGNAEHIREQQTVFLENWNTLQERSTRRKKELQASCDLQRFLASVRDLTDWANSLKNDCLTEEKVRDVNGAKALYYEHERLKVEIKAREESFGIVVQSGQTMIEDKHYASEEINAKIQQLLAARETLHAAWQRKRVFLEQLIDLHFFLRDAKQLDATSTSQEAYLNSIVVGTTVEEVAAQVKKLDEFEILVSAQDEKLTALQDQAIKLIEQQHYDSANVKKKIEEVAIHRARVKDLFRARKTKLADSLHYNYFDRDVAEAESWIDEKMKKLAAENMIANVTLEAKIKKLQKHQAFQSELSANKQRIIAIQEAGEKLLNKRHEESPRIRRQLDQLIQNWKQLLLESENYSRGLEEAQDILEFNNQAEKIEAWIREKDIMVQAGDVGRDYEHCDALLKRLGGADSDIQVDNSWLQDVNNLADKVIRQGRSDTRSIQQRRDELNQKWRNLIGAMEEYKKQLNAALEIHAFYRDCDDLDDRIAEKAIAVSVEDCGKDLIGVETLQRKLDALEREITAIDEKLRDQDSKAKFLIQKYPNKANATLQKHAEVQESWRNLQTKCRMRKHLLESSHTLQKFYAKLHELESWVEVMISRMNESLPAKDIPSAKHQLELHQERKAEIDGRQEAFRKLKDFGHRILKSEHYAKVEVEQQLAHLEELRRTVIQAWEEKKQMLSQCLDLQKFYSMADKCDSWLASKEAFLNNEDLGDTIASVEVLLRKHEGFEKTVEAQSGQIKALERFAMELVAYKHYASVDIQSRLKTVCQRLDRLKELAMIRQNKLKESKQLQHFLRNIHEVFGWIHEKHITASDANYLDFSNLQGKIEKHQAFQAELMANKGRVDAVNQEGETLIGAGHFAAMEMQAKLDELETSWRELLDSTQLKHDRLNDAYKAQLLYRTLDEIEFWMEDVEHQLQSEDHGDDLNSVQKLLKKHQHLETSMHSQADQVEQAKNEATLLCNNNHFMSDEIQERIQNMSQRFTILHEPVQIRRENLEEALSLQQFLRDVDDELSWIKEKERLASSPDLGSSLTAVQNLQKKHNGLEAEIQIHEPLIQAVISRAQQMIRSNHFAASTVEKRMQTVTSELQRLKDLTSIRRLRLSDAVESQMFYTEIAEALVWVEDKRQIINSGDFGKDLDSVQSLQKKHDAFQRDIEGFGSNVGRLHQISQRLIDRGHFDAETIKKRQNEVDEIHKELLLLCESRRRRLHDQKKLFKFYDEASDVTEWINEQAAVVASEDNGRDLEHVEIIIQKFDKFLSSLMAGEVRIAKISQSATSLIDSGHPDPEKIKYKSEEILQLWEDLKFEAQQRKEELAGAKEIHIYDRKADETITWIQEKQASILTLDSSSDLEAIQILIRKHESFERDLAAVKDQVEFVIGQASKLVSKYPDARDHITVKSAKTIDIWNSLLEAASVKKEQLHQAEELQAYFNNCKECLTWLAEVKAKIESTELARDVSGAELLLARHREISVEIDSRKDGVMALINNGQKLIDDDHFMSDKIHKVVTQLQAGFDDLQQTWKRREQEYQIELDRQIFLRDVEQHSSWLQSRQAIINDTAVGSSINEVEDLLRKHEDFEKTVQAQEEKIKEIQRLTLIEEVYNRRKKLEEEEKKLEHFKKEQERLDALKKHEQQKILDERRKDGERRRTQEIKFDKIDVIDVPINGSIRSHASSQERLNRVGVGQSGSSSPKREMSRRGSAEIPESLKLSLPKNLTENTGTNLRRGESLKMDKLLKSNDSSLSVKRAESMKLDDGSKRVKQRVPSFSTRKRSIKGKHGKEETTGEVGMPPVEMKGILERKQELQNGGKKATIRSWKNYFTVLCGQLMCFFKDEYDFLENKAASPPFNVHQANCTVASDYTKKKHVLRLRLGDGAEYLFAAENAELMQEWVKKLDFYSSIPPSMQLMSYGARKSIDNHNQSSHQSVETESSQDKSNRPRQNSSSSADSYSSAPEDVKVSVNPTGEIARSPGRHNDRINTDMHIYANVGLPRVQSFEKVKPPPIPMRNSSISAPSVPSHEPAINSNRSSVPYSEGKSTVICAWHVQGLHFNYLNFK